MWSAVAWLWLWAGPVPAPVAAVEPGLTVRVGGQLRVRPEYRSSLGPSAPAADGFVGQRTRVAVAVESPRLRVLVEFQDARLWGSEASTVAHQGDVDLHQAWIQIPDLASGLSLRLGRQELAYGDQRLVGALDWATAGRSFDAGVVTRAWAGGSLDVFAALVQDRASSGRGSGDTVLWGAYGRGLRGRPGRQLDLYVFGLHDGAVVPGESAGARATQIATLGVRATREPVRGLQASAEAAYQWGHKGPDAHEGFAVAVSAGYTLRGRLQPRLRLEWDLASGDGDASDGRSREFENLFPTNHVHYGYADLVGWRNLRALRVSIGVAPRPGQQLSADVHQLRLHQARGAWRDAGGAVLARDGSGESGRDIGTELDLTYRATWRQDAGVLVGYSVFFPGGFANATRGGRTQSFVYGQLLIRF